jgi:hypothetical protein
MAPPSPLFEKGLTRKSASIERTPWICRTKDRQTCRLPSTAGPTEMANPPPLPSAPSKSGAMPESGDLQRELMNLMDSGGAGYKFRKLPVFASISRYNRYETIRTAFPFRRVWTKNPRLRMTERSGLGTACLLDDKPAELRKEHGEASSCGFRGARKIAESSFRSGEFQAGSGVWPAV